MGRSLPGSPLQGDLKGCSQGVAVVVGRMWPFAVGQKLPSVPCHVGLSNPAISQASQEGKSTSKTQVTVLSNLVSPVTAHRFCHILFERSEPLGPATLKGRGLHRRAGTRRWGSFGSTLESISHLIPQTGVCLPFIQKALRDGCCSSSSLKNP